MPKHRRCKNCDFNLVWNYSYIEPWKHKLGGGHCDKPEPVPKT